MPRKPRSDSTTAALAAFDKATNGVKPPAHIQLRDGDLPFWRAIVSARAQWNDHDLAQAANLARCYADIERLQQEINREGDIIENGRGNPVQNPKHNLLEVLSRRSVSLSRIIQVHAQATQGDSGDQKKRNKAAAKVMDVVAAAGDDDGLIPGMAH